MLTQETENEIILQKPPDEERDPVDITDLASPRKAESRPTACRASEVLGVNWKPMAERVDNGRVAAELLGAVVRDRAELEREYAASLRAIAARLDTVPPTESDTVRRGVASLASMMDTRARGAETFAENAVSDIVKATLGPTIRNHSRVFSQISYDGAACNKDVQFSQEDYESKQRAYVQACVEAEKLANQFQSAAAAHGAARNKLVTKSLAALGAVQKTESLYLKAVSNLNTVYEAYNKQASIMLNSLEEMDRKRMQCVHDSLRKLTVFESSLVTQNKYETDHLIRVTNEIDVEKDLEEYFCRVPEPTPVLEHVVSKLWPDVETDVSVLGAAAADSKKNWSTSVLNNVVSGLDSLISAGLPDNKRKTTPDDLEEEASYVPAVGVTDALAREYSYILEALHRGDMGILEERAGRKVKDDLSSSLHRYVLCLVLQQLHDDGKVEFPTMYALRALGALVVWALEFCERQLDFWNARSLMVLAPWFSAHGTMADDPQQVKFTWPKSTKGYQKLQAVMEQPSEGDRFSWTLHRCIYHHRLWNRVQFWEDTLTYTIAEFKQGEFLAQQHDDPDTFLEEFNKKNPLRSSLQLMAPLMVSYGILHQQVSHLILKICVNYDLGEETATEMLSSLKDDSILPTAQPVAEANVEFHSLSNTVTSEE
ncbi:MAG: hypothetical protein KVP17_003852 [Porospora cf. gigantea B]|uniref:uncharacterized protein n=1 Tax=Porospora cf. gigantea B TaxID=2853592 RepID=UPI003571AE87|nr:MAG: hypothetical protein KVP17_003852 [Porospora cf. gigantea B]